MRGNFARVVGVVVEADLSGDVCGQGSGAEPWKYEDGFQLCRGETYKYTRVLAPFKVSMSCAFLAMWFWDGLLHREFVCRLLMEACMYTSMRTLRLPLLQRDARQDGLDSVI
jgi:hypothetical protein